MAKGPNDLMLQKLASWVSQKRGMKKRLVCRTNYLNSCLISSSVFPLVSGTTSATNMVPARAMPANMK